MFQYHELVILVKVHQNLFVIIFYYINWVTMKQQQWWYRHTCFTSPTHVLTHTPPSSILQVHSNNTSALLPWQPIFSLTGRISVFGATHTKKVSFSVIQKPFNNRMCRFRTERNATQWSGNGRGEYIDYKNFTDRQKSITFPHLSEAQEQRMKRLEHEGKEKVDVKRAEDLKRSKSESV